MRSLTQLRDEIRSGKVRGAKFLSRLDAYAPDPGGSPASGYDALDAIVDDLLLDDDVPEPRHALEAGMVQYQPTPVRVVLALIAAARVGEDDVFIDIGSGLGQVPMLVHLATSARTIGIEIDSAYCEYARHRAAVLNLANVTFRNEDARAADYRDATVIFMYTPVEGEMLRAVLGRIRTATRNREVRLLTYGPCTEAVAACEWVTPMPFRIVAPESASVFVSR